MQSNFYYDKPLGYVQSSTTAFNSAALVSSLTFSGQAAAGIPEGTQLLVIQPEGQAIRMRDDGSAPTTAVGYPLQAGTEFRYAGALAALQLIGQATGGIVNVWAFG